ncbi:hypothetical protein ScPMuIL_014437 [Solemya velum]
MAGFLSSSIWLKIAFIGLCLASVLFVIGFATVAWMSYDHPQLDYGLWKTRYCSGRQCQETEVDNRLLRTLQLDGQAKDWYRASQVMECFGLVCMLIALILLFVFVFAESCRRRNILIAIIALIFAAVVFMIIGISVFATKFENRGGSVGWSMGLAIASAIFAFVSDIMLVLELKK